LEDNESIGVPIEDTHPALQTDVYKELINKFAWVIGSTYRAPYRNKLTQTRKLAAELAKIVIDSAGYPRHIAR